MVDLICDVMLIPCGHKSINSPHPPPFPWEGELRFWCWVCMESREDSPNGRVGATLPHCRWKSPPLWYLLSFQQQQIVGGWGGKCAQHSPEPGNRFASLSRTRAHMLLGSFWSKHSPVVCLSPWSLGTVFVHSHVRFKRFC